MNIFCQLTLLQFMNHFPGLTLRYAQLRAGCHQVRYEGRDLRQVGLWYVAVRNTAHPSTTVIGNNTPQILHKILVSFTTIQFPQELRFNEKTSHDLGQLIG